MAGETFTGLIGRNLSLEGATASSSGDEWPAEVIVGGPESPLLVRDVRFGNVILSVDRVRAETAWRANDNVVLVSGTCAGSCTSTEQQTAPSQYKNIISLRCASSSQAAALCNALRPVVSTAATVDQVHVAASQLPAAGHLDGGHAAPHVACAMTTGNSNAFDAKTDKGSADLYFHYYGMLQHQQNMLQDVTRTGTYNAAILENCADFEGRTVMDVGAGSGILSLFAAQAGARKVYAVEASGMATFARQLAERNAVGKAVQVCHCKVEELTLPEPDGRVDVLVSEPMGTLLVNERMLETYIYARDHFLRPGGKMFPQVGRIHAALFSDPVLHGELLGKALFWQQPNFYGLDMSALHAPAVEGFFAQVVVDAFDPALLVSNCATRVFDFATIKEEELHTITLPLELTIAHPCTVHGVATWFDVLFAGSTSQRWLSTAPGLPTTHWFQLRCCLQTPLLVLSAGTSVSGSLKLVAHERQSYNAMLELTAPPVGPGMPPQRSTGTFDLKEPYYRQLTAWAQVQTAPQQQVLQQQAVALQQQAAILQQQQAVAAVAAAAALASPAGAGGSLAAPTVLTGGITTTPRAAQSGHQLQLQTHRESVV